MDIDTNLDPNVSLKGGKGGKGSFIVLGLIAVAAIALFVLRSVSEQKERAMHAKVMQSLADIEHGEVAKFWQCALGPNVDPGLFPDNLALGLRIESQFATEPKTYLDKVKNECLPMAAEAKQKIDKLDVPTMYTEAFKQYGKALEELGAAFEGWTKTAPAQIEERELGKKVQEGGTAWHSFAGGAPTPPVIGYDHFLHCAVPNVDGMKDQMELAQALFDQCKNPAFTQRLESECGKHITAPPVAPTPGFKTALKKMQAEDREQQAFDDCLRKNRKGKRRDDLAAVGKAWKDYMDAGSSVRKIGKEAFKNG